MSEIDPKFNASIFPKALDEISLEKTNGQKFNRHQDDEQKIDAFADFSTKAIYCKVEPKFDDAVLKKVIDGTPNKPPNFKHKLA